MTTPQRKFAGLAYWTLAQAGEEWVDLAIQAVQPLCDQGKLVVETNSPLDGSKELMLSFPNGTFIMRAKNGEGRGVVRDAPMALAVVLCLMAMQRKLPMLSLVDDAQLEFPRISQKFGLYAEQWEVTLELAELLGLAPGKQFLEQEGAITHLMF